MQLKNTKIIFLDIDGVLNSEELAKDIGWGGHFEEYEETTHDRVKWQIHSVIHLRRVVEDTGAKIVISSSWRKYFSLDKFKEMFAIYGWQNAPIIDKTINGFASRGFEVNRWLSDNKVENYVILDDYPDFLPEQAVHFVEINPEVGLTNNDAHRAITILNRSNELIS